MQRLCLLQCFSPIFDLTAPCVYYYTITTHVSPNYHVFRLSPHSSPPKKTHICTSSLCGSSTALCSCRKQSPPPSPLMLTVDSREIASISCLHDCGWGADTHTQLSALQASLCIITRHISLYYNKKVIHIHVVMLSDRVDKILQPH